MISTQIFHVRVRLGCDMIHRPKNEIDAEIHELIGFRYGNKCNSLGYVYGNSIVVQARSAGIIDNLVVDGGANYEVQYAAKVVSPQQGDRFECYVLDTNKEGIQCRAREERGASSLDHLDVILPIQWHRDVATRAYLRNDVKVGDAIPVEVLGTRFQPGDRSIRVVVQYVAPPEDK